ncbi:hypothetical protein FBUS_02349 [Fasciolopsis buskii]|uniref:CUB domain-containing protein n=1 Tax=Fasciolopsis buskii TaxID=27845 RepID=A0A8E0VIF0_9TREM|nr:hypothetical protein FBUS_02349 [Fasciolopsis buski]
MFNFLAIGFISLLQTRSALGLAECACPQGTMHAQNTVHVLAIMGRTNDGVNCTGEIVSTVEGKMVKLTVSTFEVGSTTACTDAGPFVTFGETEEEALSSKTRLCGNKIPELPVNYKRKIYVYTRNFRVGNQIIVLYIAGNPVYKCPTGPLVAPDSETRLIVPTPGSIFPADFLCTYELRSTEGKYLSMRFEKFKIGTSDQCFVDSGFVSTGLTKMQSEMSREVYCGTTPPPLNYGKISTLFITLEGDKLAAESGFTLGYKSVPHNPQYTCPSKSLTAGKSENTLVVPTQGFDLPTQFNCTYEIKSSSNKHELMLIFSHFKIGSTNSCTPDGGYLTVELTKEEALNSSRKFCGSAIPSLEHIKKAETVFIHIHGKKFTDGDGFTLIYKAGSVQGSQISLVLLLSMVILTFNLTSETGSSIF